MPTRRTITDADKRRIRALHKKGLGRNAIARELGLSLATVTKVCQDAGLSFDRAATRVAVAARQIDLRARRQAITQRLYGRAEDVLARLEADEYVYTVTVAGQGTETVHDTAPPAQDERNLASSITAYLQSAVRLEQVDGDTTVSKAASTITRLAEAFGINDA